MTTPPPILALTGPAGCGKSTIARTLETQHGFRRLSFAEPIRAMAAPLLRAAGLNASETTWHLTDPDGKHTQLPASLGGVTARHLLQTLGTEWARRYIGPDVWIALILDRIDRGTGPVAIDDLRCPREADAIRRAGGVVIRLIRPGCQLSPEASAHATERPVPVHLVDYDLDNHRAPDQVALAAISLLRDRPNPHQATLS